MCVRVCLCVCVCFFKLRGCAGSGVVSFRLVPGYWLVTGGDLDVFNPERNKVTAVMSEPNGAEPILIDVSRACF